MKKSNLVTVVLLVYLAVMACIGWPHYIGEGRYGEYIGIIAITLIAIFALRYVQGKKERMRDRNRNNDPK
ncbi:MAG: hypothetical protein J1E02_06365 [Coprobacter sp.]|nr:hypothetical protein [Coprobacter sp.]